MEQRPTLIVTMAMPFAVIEPLQPPQNLSSIVHDLLQFAQSNFDHVGVGLYRMLLRSDQITDESDGFLGVTQRVAVTKCLCNKARLVMPLCRKPGTGGAWPTALCVRPAPLDQIQCGFRPLRPKTDPHQRAANWVEGRLAHDSVTNQFLIHCFTPLIQPAPSGLAGEPPIL